MSCSRNGSGVLSLKVKMQELFTDDNSPYSLDSEDGFINLPDDILREVLCRVSLIEVVNLSTVNRDWYSEVNR